MLITDTKIEMYKNREGHLRMRDTFGFVYQNYQKLPNGSLYWRCSMYRKSGFMSCKAKAKSFESFLVSQTGEHNHLPIDE